MANFGRDLGDMAVGAVGGGILACLFQRLALNKYLSISALGFSRRKIFVDSMRCF